ncbi:hypothetical protein AYO48_03980 [Gaiella sp. SCGC AG-212-M14]|nr:hypothetical protein AYO48_03980 [Gaiella sp. SCGC AG-212-M14]
MFIVIVNPGPTVPVSVLVFLFVFAAADVELASASVARIVVRPMVIKLICSSLVRGDSACVEETAWREAQRRASRRAAIRYCGHPPTAYPAHRDPLRACGARP